MKWFYWIPEPKKLFVRRADDTRGTDNPDAVIALFKDSYGEWIKLLRNGELYT